MRFLINKNRNKQVKELAGINPLTSKSHGFIPLDMIIYYNFMTYTLIIITIKNFEKTGLNYFL